jgi:type II secretory pathway pseudopilin PulG
MELLAVIAVISLVSVLVAPAFRNVGAANSFNKAACSIQGCIEQARNFAMANNTYVYIGFAEVDANVNSTTVPQVNAGSAAFGRVAMAIVSTKDGSSGYGEDVSNWASNYAGSIQGNLVAVGKLQYFENLHLCDLGANPPSSGGMARSQILNSTTPSYNVGNSGCVASTPFAWPLGAPLSAAAGAPVNAPAQYVFYKVLQFDPTGAACIPSSSSASGVLMKYIEIGLQEMHGDVAPAAPSDQQRGTLAAIRIDGATGITRLYRP